MAFINVDHSKFASAASAIDTYVSSMKNNMSAANSEVNVLSASWGGSDSSHFKTKWDEVDNDESTYHQMKKSLESYSDFLEYAAEKYKTAQTNAVNKANRLIVF